ncbi:nuclear transport factor 2 family protein [Pusillimonas noertemannii]|nr:nuclear transport factor 2 family protein [Pusillimonas noertemannii]
MEMKRHTVQALEATLGHRLAIEELNAWVAHCLDHKTYQEMADAFTEDAVYISGPRALTGPEEIVQFFEQRRQKGGPRSTRHMGDGLRLQFSDDGRKAMGRSVWISYACNAEAPVDTLSAFMVADFEDSYVLQDDGMWRISERVIRPVFKNPEAAPAA